MDQLGEKPEEVRKHIEDEKRQAQKKEDESAPDKDTTSAVTVRDQADEADNKE